MERCLEVKYSVDSSGVKSDWFWGKKVYHVAVFNFCLQSEFCRNEDPYKSLIYNDFSQVERGRSSKGYRKSSDQFWRKLTAKTDKKKLMTPFRLFTFCRFWWIEKTCYPNGVYPLTSQKLLNEASTGETKTTVFLETDCENSENHYLSQV